MADQNINDPALVRAALTGTERFPFSPDGTATANLIKHFTQGQAKRVRISFSQNDAGVITVHNTFDNDYVGVTFTLTTDADGSVVVTASAAVFSAKTFVLFNPMLMGLGGADAWTPQQAVTTASECRVGMFSFSNVTFTQGLFNHTLLEIITFD